MSSFNYIRSPWFCARNITNLDNIIFDRRDRRFRNQSLHRRYLLDLYPLRRSLFFAWNWGKKNWKNHNAKEFGRYKKFCSNRENKRFKSCLTIA